MVSIRASVQSHQTPHTRRPQIIPVTSVRAQNSTPISMADADSRSAAGERRIRYQTAPARPTPRAR